MADVIYAISDEQFSDLAYFLARKSKSKGA